MFRGEIGGRLFNFNGSVDVLADVVGYDSANVVTDFEVVSEVDVVDLGEGDTAGLAAACPAGKKAVSGGASIIENDGLQINSSVPNDDLSGWSAGVTFADEPGTGRVRAYAVCASGVVLSPTP